VLVNPHVACNSTESGENMPRIAYAALEAFLKWEKLQAVNAV
jgi:phosphoglycerate dehydrogenase-like enzyme